MALNNQFSCLNIATARGGTRGASPNSQHHLTPDAVGLANLLCRGCSHLLEDNDDAIDGDGMAVGDDGMECLRTPEILHAASELKNHLGARIMGGGGGILEDPTGDCNDPCTPNKDDGSRDGSDSDTVSEEDGQYEYTDSDDCCSTFGSTCSSDSPSSEKESEAAQSLLSVYDQATKNCVTRMYEPESAMRWRGGYNDEGPTFLVVSSPIDRRLGGQRNRNRGDYQRPKLCVLRDGSRRDVYAIIATPMHDPEEGLFFYF